VIPAFHNLPDHFVEFGEKGVCLDRCVDVREVNPVCKGEAEGVNIRAAPNKGFSFLALVGEGEGIFKRVHGVPPWEVVAPRAGDQHPRAAGEGTSDRCGGFPSHDQMVSHRQSFEVFEVCG